MIVAPRLFRVMTSAMRWSVASLWLALLASCNEETPPSTGGGGSAVAKAGGSGGSFSAELAKEFASSTGSGAAKAGSADPKAGSADPKAGSADPKAGSADPKAGSADPKAGSADPKAGSADPKAGSADPKAGSADPKAGSAEPPKVATGPGPIIQSSGTTPKKVAVPADLAAIKFVTLPNWERDVQDAGTISLPVKVPGSGEKAIFVFRYGYEDASAPKDREEYKKWLAGKRLLTVRQDRQSGQAWFLDGLDGGGNPAFRFVVQWGEKKLICFGSYYKDAESNRLGDIRDQTIIQAKQICESISL